MQGTTRTPDGGLKDTLSLPKTVQKAAPNFTEKLRNGFIGFLEENKLHVQRRHEQKVITLVDAVVDALNYIAERFLQFPEFPAEWNPLLLARGQKRNKTREKNGIQQRQLEPKAAALQHALGKIVSSEISGGWTVLAESLGKVVNSMHGRGTTWSSSWPRHASHGIPAGPGRRPSKPKGSCLPRHWKAGRGKA